MVRVIRSVAVADLAEELARTAVSMRASAASPEVIADDNNKMRPRCLWAHAHRQKD